MKYLIFLQFSLLIVLNASAQQAALKNNILQLEHKWVDVALKHDANAFAAMMSDNYVRMNPDGTVGTKGPWVNAIRSGKTTYEWVNIYNMDVKQHGPTAIVTGKFAQKANKNGRDEVVTGSFMNTWQQQKGKWLIVSSAFYTKDSLDAATASLKDSAMIVELEHKWVKTAIDGDAATFASMMADNYVGLYPDGKLGRKKSWVASVQSGRNKYEYVHLTNLKVYMNRETAVVTGKYDEKAFVGGKERLSKGSYMSTWAKVNGHWLIAANAFTDDPK